MSESLHRRLCSGKSRKLLNKCRSKARFPLPELTGDRFRLPVNNGRVDGRAFPLAELTGRQLG